jgi:hypothetical protein
MRVRTRGLWRPRQTGNEEAPRVPLTDERQADCQCGMGTCPYSPYPDDVKPLRAGKR